MTEIGIREFKIRASEIIRDLRERRTRYVLTYRGQPIGLLLPFDEDAKAGPGKTDSSAWEELVRLGEEIAQGWESPLSSSELLSEMRR